MVTTRKKARGGKAKAGVIKRAPKKTELESAEPAPTTVIPDVRVGPGVPADMVTDVDMTAPRFEVSQSPLGETPTSDVPMSTPLPPPEGIDPVPNQEKRLSTSSNVSSRRGSLQKSPRGSLTGSPSPSPRGSMARSPSPSPRAAASPIEPALRSPRGSITPKPSPSSSPRPAGAPEGIKSPGLIPAPEGSSPKTSSRRNSGERRLSNQSTSSK